MMEDISKHRVNVNSALFPKMSDALEKLGYECSDPYNSHHGLQVWCYQSSKHPVLVRVDKRLDLEAKPRFRTLDVTDEDKMFEEKEFLKKSLINYPSDKGVLEDVQKEVKSKFKHRQNDWFDIVYSDKEMATMLRRNL